MRTVSLRLADLQRSVIPIGFEDENLHTQVRIDCKKLFEEYPNALPSLAVVPPKGTAYPAIVTKDGDYVVWDVTASDTAVEGTGEIQLTFVMGEEVSKSYVGKVHVMKSIRSSGTAPDPIQNWITIANVVLDSVAHAVESALHAPIIDDNGYWNVWDADEDEYVPTEYKAEGKDGLDGVGITSIEKTGTSGLVDTYTVTFTNGTSMTFTVTNGEDGTDGISPTATVTKSGKIATITITDKNGTTSVQLHDGEDADPTELIDDSSTGAGKTWSSNKIASENLSLKTEIVNRPEVKESDKTGVDFDLSDEDGNVVLRLKDGHVETKNFDSSNIGKDSSRSGADLDISDENGNVILRLKDGGIETKYFDSKYFKNPIEAYSVSATYDRSKINTLTIQHPFKKGEEIYFHLDDGNRYDAFGRYATYYEGNTAVTGNRRGSNGYIRHVITADCDSVGITIAASEYTDGIGLTLWVYKINGEIKPTIVTVKSDGTGMFQTIKAAVDSISGANHLTNPYMIEVYPGTYDCLEGYTDEEIASADIGGSYTQDSMVGIKLTDGISMRGVGRCDDIILTAELASSWSSGVRGNISTLNLQGEGSLENMTIVGKNIRYCIHDDFRSPVNSHDKRILRNLKFKGEYLSYYPHFTTYGAGMSAPRDYLIENCDFGYDLGIHSNGGYAFGCTIEVNNCSGCRFRIGDSASADTDAVNRVIVNNCNFQVIRINHADNTLKNHMKLEGVGNENSMIRNVNPDLYRLGMITLAPVGLTTGKLVKRDASGLGLVETHDIAVAYGVVIGSDTDYSYVQKTGYISSVMLGLSGLAVGDYVTVNTSTNMIEDGGTESNAVGVVMAVDQNNAAYIKLMI